MLLTPTTAFVFPGQGSQEVGMGKDIADSYAVAREVFEQADDVLGFGLSRLCFEGPEAELTDTINQQPALLATSIAILRAVRGELPELTFSCAAGHSLGEITALVAASALSLEDGLRLVRERGRLMKLAGERSPGAMVALLGIDSEQVCALCDRVRGETNGILVLANDNCPGQSVISGDTVSIDRALEYAKDAGARRAVKLPITIAAHSPLMGSVSDAFAACVAGIDVQPANASVYGNVTAKPLVDAEAIRTELGAQLTQPVRWSESVQAMAAAGIRHFIEIGSKDVLTGLVKRINKEVTATPVNNSAALRKLQELATAKE